MFSVNLFLNINDSKKSIKIPKRPTPIPTPIAINPYPNGSFTALKSKIIIERHNMIKRIENMNNTEIFFRKNLFIKFLAVYFSISVHQTLLLSYRFLQ